MANRLGNRFEHRPIVFDEYGARLAHERTYKREMGCGEGVPVRGWPWDGRLRWQKGGGVVTMR